MTHRYTTILLVVVTLTELHADHVTAAIRPGVDRNGFATRSPEYRRTVIRVHVIIVSGSTARYSLHAPTTVVRSLGTG
jgi:hypothetical protein